MKNFIRIMLLATILSSTLPLASAATFDFDFSRDIMKKALDGALGILSPFFEAVIGDYNSSEFFFSKVLLLILLTIIIAKVLEKTPIGKDRRGVSLIISILVSILSIRFINQNDLFEAIFIQYGVLGIAITTVLPMVIFFYFVHNTNVGSYGRKVFWAIYTITLGAIWISKSSEIPEVANWIYALTFLAAIIFIFMDKTIHSYFGLADFKKFEKESNKEAIRIERRKMVEARRDLRDGVIDMNEYTRLERESERIIRELSKE